MHFNVHELFYSHCSHQTFLSLLRPPSGWYFYKNTKTHIWLVVPSSQLTTFVHLYSCNNNVTPMMAAIAAETFWWENYEWNSSQTFKCILLFTYILWVWLVHWRWAYHNNLDYSFSHTICILHNTGGVQNPFAFPVLAVPPVICAFKNGKPKIIRIPTQYVILMEKGNGLDKRGFVVRLPAASRDLFFYIASRKALDLIQPPIQLESGIFPRVKIPGREVNQLTPLSASRSSPCRPPRNAQRRVYTSVFIKPCYMLHTYLQNLRQLITSVF